MSLLDIFRDKNDKLRELEEENEILRHEVYVLKNLLFNLELDELIKKKRKK